jgi:pyrroloquinoline quinone biosynthesis protein B
VKTLVLGSAAGGGYPQWNCLCPTCTLFWNGDARVRRRTQSSIATTVDNAHWVLINCSPDIREQITSIKALHPKTGPRHSPIVSVVLTNGDIDHIGGLINLREAQAFTIWAAAAVIEQINANPIFGVLNRELVNFKTIEPNVSFSPVPELVIEAFDVPGKIPLYREDKGTPEVSRNGNTIGLHLSHQGRTLSYVPGCGDIDDQLLHDLRDTSTLLFDGTLWIDDEMIRTRTGVKTGRRMGHVPVSGHDGSMAKLESLGANQKIFVHLNNTNPLLIEDSPEQIIVRNKGWRVAFDGMEIVP